MAIDHLYFNRYNNLKRAIFHSQEAVNSEVVVLVDAKVFRSNMGGMERLGKLWRLEA